MLDLIKNKKILLVGLGRLGGGVSTAKFLVENGAKLTVTDLNSKNELKNSLAKLKKYKINPHTIFGKDYDVSKSLKPKPTSSLNGRDNKASSKNGAGVKYTLGEHKEEDFLNNDIIVFNQAVSVYNKWVQFARKNKKQIETDLSLMLKILNVEKPQTEYIAITGTRGKTTTTTWTHHFLKPAFIGGNIPELAPLKVLDKILVSLAKAKATRGQQAPVDAKALAARQGEKNISLVLEIPSYQLEYFELNKKLKAPKVAVITNLYIDHLNRHGDMKNYALAKSRIFSNQTKKDFLILNFDIDNGLFLKQKPKGKVFYVSLKPLPADKNGLYFYGDGIYFQKDKVNDFIAPAQSAGWRISQHQKYNLLMALLAAYLYKGEGWGKLVDKIETLPEVKFRQEIILKNKKLTVINDSAATSPEATIAAIERFKSKRFVLITGGTNKQLDFKDLAKEINKNVALENLYLLNGSGTSKLVAELRGLKRGKTRKFNVSESLEDMVKEIKKRKDVNCIVFSPGAASFEKFKNEFDRGEKFDNLIKVTFKQP